ncbi:MAG TPA: hypothetical protein VF832_12470 [Longimicrobiales bacterium]
MELLIGWGLVLLLAGAVALVLRRFGAPGGDRGEQRPHCPHCSVPETPSATRR